MARLNSTMGKAKKAPPQGPFYDDYVEAINKEPVNKRNRALFGLQMSVQEGWGWWKPGWKDGHVARTYEQVKDVLRNIVDFEENEWMQNENMSLKEMRDNIQNNITGNTELQNQLTYLKEHIAEGNPKFLGEEEIDDLLEVIENKINADNFSPEERDIELVKLIQLTELTCTLIPSYLYYSKYKFKIENIVINQILHKIDLNGPGAARLDEMPTLRRIYRVYLLRLRENADMQNMDVAEGIKRKSKKSKRKSKKSKRKSKRKSKKSKRKSKKSKRKSKKSKRKSKRKSKKSKRKSLRR